MTKRVVIKKKYNNTYCNINFAYRTCTNKIRDPVKKVKVKIFKLCITNQGRNLIYKSYFPVTVLVKDLTDKAPIHLLYNDFTLKVCKDFQECLDPVCIYKILCS